MFVQVIRGRTSDADGLRAALDRWEADLAPGAVGWLGSTGGVTEDGRVIMAVRFESEEAARRNSERPEQDRWWRETEKLIDGATFLDSSDVLVDLHGDPDQAGFVQVMQGRTSDPVRARRLMAQDTDTWAAFRPDLVGSLDVLHDGGAYTMVLYFTSEDAAREGERKELPPELKSIMDEMDELAVGETEFFDLERPEMRSATPGA